MGDGQEENAHLLTAEARLRMINYIISHSASTNRSALALTLENLLTLGGTLHYSTSTTMAPLLGTTGSSRGSGHPLRAHLGRASDGDDGYSTNSAFGGGFLPRFDENSYMAFPSQRLDGAGGANREDDFTTPYIEWRHPLWSVLLISICLMTVAGNCLVVVAVCTKKYLRNSTGYLIVSLAFADLIVGMVVMPLNSLFEMSRHVWLLGLPMCDLFHALDILASTASIWNLCVISVDRYVAGIDPIGYRERVSKRRITIAILAVWVMSACLSFPAIAWWHYTSPQLYENEYQCLFTDSKLYVVFSSLVSFYVPLVVILFAYGRVFLIATRHTQSLMSGMKKLHIKAGGGGSRSPTTVTSRQGGENHNNTDLNPHNASGTTGSTAVGLTADTHITTTKSHRSFSIGDSAATLRIHYFKRRLDPAPMTPAMRTIRRSTADRQQQLHNTDGRYWHPLRILREAARFALPKFFQPSRGSGEVEEEGYRNSRERQLIVSNPTASALPDVMDPDHERHGSLLGSKSADEESAVTTTTQKDKPYSSIHENNTTEIMDGRIERKDYYCELGPDVKRIPHHTSPQRQRHPRWRMMGKLDQCGRHFTQSSFALKFNPPSSTTTSGCASRATVVNDSAATEAASCLPNGGATEPPLLMPSSPATSNAVSREGSLVAAVGGGGCSAKQRNGHGISLHGSENGGGREGPPKRGKGGGKGMGRWMGSGSRVREKSRQVLKYVHGQRAARTLSIVVGVFILCWTPFFVLSPVMVLCRECITDADTFFAIITWVGHLNSMLNPLIYSRFSRDFRRAFKQILTCEKEERATNRAMATPLNIVLAQIVAASRQQPLPPPRRVASPAAAADGVGSGKLSPPTPRLRMGELRRQHRQSDESSSNAA